MNYVKIKMLAGLVPSGGFRGEIPSFFQLLDAVGFSWLLATSLQSLSPSSRLLLTLFTDPCDYIGPIYIVQNHLSISRSLM